MILRLQAMLDNGILQVMFSVPEGFVTRIRYGGLDNLFDNSKKESNRGLIGASFNIIKHNQDYAEISFLCPRSSSVPLQVDKRFVMLRGSSGFYSYAVFKREEGWPALAVSQIRAVYKPRSDKFHYMAISDKIRRIMPMPQDRETGQPLAYKEAVLLTNPTNPALKGEVDDKYQYACEDKDNKVVGWISFDPPIGMWVVTPSDEFRLGGPVKQDLTAHVGPTLLAMFHSTHYAGEDLIMSFQNGEPWTKVFGPHFVHLNSLHGKGDPITLWQKAKDEMVKEVKSWPYDFVLSKDFPKANQRGSILGRLLVNDRFQAPKPADSAWIGLATPGDAGSWQIEMKGYQFWTRADADGRFLIENIHNGTYSLYAWAPGFIGNFKSATNVTINPGKKIDLGDVVYVPPRVGPTLWEIGVPDRSAAEFFVPDPSPNLTNRLFVNDIHDKYRQYGLWHRYTDLYPEHDLIYTVGKSDFRKDWFFAQVLRRRGSTYQPTTWQTVFHINAVTPNANYTLQIALASATQSELQVRINNPDSSKSPLFTTRMIGRDNAIARHGIHGLYWLFSVNIPSSFIRTGDNTISLTQFRNSFAFSGIMYDYLRLEGPPTS
ncbi:hypothetical protein Cgig2_007224 [Carnegiea gigantea]|uniref:rhamnogalacturonan endolyase n=1 Tax=Carnegiea gigantea TaxID=171969 RepID=A0A9Q1QS91_9CARY|nr:hypothetical protein Cgig2_007224 [Carnegiea gigantea]